MPPRKTAAERQKDYRDKLKIHNPEKYEEIKKKTAARALEYYRKKQKNLTEEQKEELRVHRKALDQKAKNQENVSEGRTDDVITLRLDRKRRLQLLKVQNNVKKLQTGFKSLQKKFYRQQLKLHELDKTCENLKAELNALKVKNNETQNFNDYTPLKQTEQYIDENLKDINTPQKEAVKKTLLEHNVLKASLKETFSSSPRPTKNILKEIVDNKLVKKYKLKTNLTQSLGLKSNFKKYRNTKQKTNKIINLIKEFYMRDDVSRASAGKKECVTRKKVKMQKRYLLANLKTLHNKFVNEVKQISFSTFKKYRPFYIISPTLKDLNTCACIKHSNMQFRANKMKSLHLIETDNLNDIISTTVCDLYFKICMYGECDSCAERHIQGNDNLTEIITWYEWKNLDHEYGEGGHLKKTKKMTKTEREGSVQDLINAFNKDLAGFKRHIYNVYHQYRQYKFCKENLKDNEVLIHIDFSENWTTKYFEEVQAMHFGASKTQITLHTGVYYLKGAKPVSFCSISPDNRHNPEAIWAHLDPVLKEIKSSYPNIDQIHFYSDGPTTQYRQKNNFYLFSRNIYDYGFIYGTWSFFEASHGKGAVDGIGGAIKRSLDFGVSQGHDIPNAEKAFEFLRSSETAIKNVYVPAEKIQDLVPDTCTKLIPLKNTMKLHQLITEKKFTIKHRELSCFCRNLDGRCDCYAPNVHSFEQDDENPDKNDNLYVLDEETGCMRAECRQTNMSKHAEDIFDDDIELGDEDHLMSVDEDVFSSIQSNDRLSYQKQLQAKSRRYDDSENENSDSYSVHDSSDNEGSIHSGDTLQDCSEKVSEPGSNDNENELSIQIVDVDSYVLVKFKLEKRSKYYVGQVLEAFDNAYKVKFLRNKGKGKFTWPITDDISLVEKDDIENIVPNLIYERRGIKTFDIPNKYKIE